MMKLLRKIRMTLALARLRRAERAFADRMVIAAVKYNSTCHMASAKDLATLSRAKMLGLVHDAEGDLIGFTQSGVDLVKRTHGESG